MTARSSTRYTTGFDRFLAYLLGETDGTAEGRRVGGRAIAAWRRSASAPWRGAWPRERTMISVTWSLQRADHGEQPFWMAITLAAMLGQIGLPGGGFGFGYGCSQPHRQSGARRSRGRRCRRAATRCRRSSRWRASPTCCCNPGRALRLRRQRSHLSRHPAGLLGRRQSRSTTSRT